MKYRPDIDGLRAVSVLAVLFYHAGYGWARGGFVGVDVFFVISGYLITGLLLDESGGRPIMLARFYERRIRRIFPALAAVVASSTMAAGVLFTQDEFYPFGKSLAAVALSVSNVGFWREVGYFDSSVWMKPLLQTWSLGVEEQFYLLFPVLLIAARRWFGAGSYAMWIGLGWAVSFASTVYAAVHGQQMAAFYLLPFRAWELLTGAFLALGIVPEFKGRTAREIAGLAGLGCILAAVFIFHAADLRLPVMLVLPVMGAAVFIHAGADGLVKKAMGFWPMVFTGRISYSLYLWHWPLMLFAGYCAADAVAGWRMAGLLAAIYSVAALSWRYIEQPFRNGAGGRRRAFSGFFAVNAAFAALGALIIWTHGLPQRLGHELSGKAVVENGIAGPEAEFFSGNRLVIGDAGAGDPATLLWGDSYAGSIAPGIDDMGKAGHRPVLMLKKLACMPAIDDAAPQREDCVYFNKAVVDMLARHQEIGTVILVARWSGYIDRWQNEKPSLDPEALKKAFVGGIAGTIRYLRAGGRRVVLVAEPPTVVYFHRHAVAQMRPYNNPGDIRPLTADYMKEQAVYFGIFDGLKKDGGVTVVYPHHMLCDAARCRVDYGGDALYFDDNHLSVQGARYLEPLFRGLIQ